jgi:circadian clock protein KaiB
MAEEKETRQHKTRQDKTRQDKTRQDSLFFLWSKIMATKKAKTSTKEFEKAISKPDQSKYVLRLYIIGMTPRSAKAIENIRKLCEEYLPGRYDLDVIDIYQQPILARGEQIIATPTLIKKLPLPLRKVIGDMSDSERFLVGIDLKPKKV